MKYTCNRRVKVKGKRYLPGGLVPLDPKDPQTERWLTDGVISAPSQAAGKEDTGAKAKAEAEEKARAEAEAKAKAEGK